MKVGDLVRIKDGYAPTDQLYWVGVIVSLGSQGPIVYWNNKYPCEHELTNQMELLNESR
jgi:hypothetical protein